MHSISGYMNIGIDIRNIGKKRTGDETVFFHIAKILPEIDKNPQHTYRLLIDTRPQEEIEDIKKRLFIHTKKNVTLEVCGSGNKFFWNFWVMPRISRKLHLDIYHTQYIVPFFLPSCTKVITHIHDISFIRYPQYLSWKDVFFLNLLIPRSLKRAENIIAVSHFTKSEIVQCFSVKESDVSVISNGVEEEFFTKKYSKGEMREIEERYQLPERYFLYIGTMQPRKNIPFFLEAFARFRRRNPGVKCVFTGNKSSYFYDREIDKVIERFDLLQDVFFLDYVQSEDLPGVIDRADALFTTSIYEGFGLPILEALSRGIAVIASDIPAHREVGGDIVRWIQNGDIAGLENILYDVSVNVSTGNTVLSERRKERARLFVWKKEMQELLRIYNQQE
jgi:glycosyltransferase involved in cell wall biosynthesis